MMRLINKRVRALVGTVCVEDHYSEFVEAVVGIGTSQSFAEHQQEQPATRGCGAMTAQPGSEHCIRFVGKYWSTFFRDEAHLCRYLAVVSQLEPERLSDISDYIFSAFAAQAVPVLWPKSALCERLWEMRTVPLEAVPIGPVREGNPFLHFIHAHYRLLVPTKGSTALIEELRASPDSVMTFLNAQCSPIGSGSDVLDEAEAITLVESVLDVPERLPPFIGLHSPKISDVCLKVVEVIHRRASTLPFIPQLVIFGGNSETSKKFVLPGAVPETQAERRARFLSLPQVSIVSAEQEKYNLTTGKVADLITSVTIAKCPTASLPSLQQFRLLTTVVISSLSNVRNLPEYFVSGCHSLAVVVLDDLRGLQEVPQRAFSYCRSLEYVTFGGAVELKRFHALSFAHVPSLRQVTIRGNLLNGLVTLKASIGSHRVLRNHAVVYDQLATTGEVEATTFGLGNDRPVVSE